MEILAIVAVSFFGGLAASVLFGRGARAGSVSTDAEPTRPVSEMAKPEIMAQQGLSRKTQADMMQSMRAFRMPEAGRSVVRGREIDKDENAK